MKQELEIQEQIAACTTMDELMGVIDSIDGIPGSYRFYNKIHLQRTIPLVYNKYDVPNLITRSLGLRKKVMELGNYEKDLIEFYCQMD